MIIARRGENTGFAQPHFRDQLKIIGHSPYPSCYLRILVSAFSAKFYRLLVAFRIQEEFTLANQPCPAVYFMQQIVNPEYLLRPIRRPGLLAVTKRRIRYPYILRYFAGNFLLIEDCFGKIGIWKCIAKKIGFSHICKFKVFIQRHLTPIHTSLVEYISTDYFTLEFYIFYEIRTTPGEIR